MGGPAVSEFQRRDLLGGVAAGALVGMFAGPALAAESPAPDELQFRFPLEQQKPKAGNGGVAREASVTEFPISRGIAGVSMFLDPGSLRELHWHANAAEWGYVVSGRCRTTIYDPEGNSEVNDFEAGDLWYFPRGHGHSIQGIGDEPCHFILVFDNGAFSEFATFSVTDWIGHTPAEVLAKQFNLPSQTFASWPKSEVYFAKGPVPQGPPPDTGAEPPLTHRFRLLSQEPQAYPGGEMYLATVQKFPIAKTISGGVMTLEPGALREMHWHPNADEWQYVISGRFRMTVFASKGRARTVEMGPGDVGYVPMGMGHYLENIGQEECHVLIAFNAGDYQEIGLLGWLDSNPDQVVATNFSLSPDIVEKFPREIFLVR
ncbi:MAG: cupin domain-containing protein [Armatimonadetes bacterium]|nr:cupin domain-containing protein [Armatimonadota bacterium]